MPRWAVILLSILFFIAITVIGGLIIFGVPPGELGELITEGPIVELRDEMRPPREGPPRVLVFALDGVGDGEFREALRTERLPRIAAFLGVGDVDEEVWDFAYAARGALSILPSTTYAAWTSIFTGEPVARTGVPGNEWFDRETMQFVAPAPVSVSGHGDAVRVYSEHLLDDWISVPTLFERADVRSYVSLLPQHRGADLLIQPDLGVFSELVESFAGGVSGDHAGDMGTYGALDRQAAEKTIEAMDEYGLADLMVVYLPGIDLYTHVATPALSEQVDYLADVVDSLVADILLQYDERGALEETYVLFVADHGHTPALEDDRNALGSGGADEWPAVVDSMGYRIRAFETETEDTTYQAVLAYQGAFAYLHLADRAGCRELEQRCDWSRPPPREDVLQMLRNIDRINRTGERVPELRGTLDLILARNDGDGSATGAYHIWDGESLVPVGAYLEANPRPDLIDLERRLREMSVGPHGHRTGDILLLSRYRFDQPIQDRFYFSKEYRSWHGSPSRQDSEVVWILARRGESGERLRRRVQDISGGRPGQLDVTPLVLNLLEVSGGP